VVNNGKAREYLLHPEITRLRYLLREQGFALRAGVIRGRNSVPQSASALKDFVIVAPRIRLVAEEVNRFEARHVLQAIGLIPALRKDVKTDLSAYGEGQVHMRELLLQHLDHRLPYFRVLCS
jgi:hypothetical protein